MRNPKPPCITNGCENPQHALGLCRSEYDRWIRFGTTITGRTSNEPAEDGAPCMVTGCQDEARQVGMCTAHYMQEWRTRQKEHRNRAGTPSMECQGTFCTEDVFRAQMCEPHYRYWRSEGQPRDIAGCIAQYERIMQSAHPTKALLGEAHVYPAPEGELHVAWPVSVTKGRRIDDRVIQGLEALALTWFETPPAKIGFQLTISRRGPLLLARATERASRAA